MSQSFGAEIESLYADRDRDRFIVSLVFGLPEVKGVTSPGEALRFVLRDLYAGPAIEEHIWCVYDAKTASRLLIQAGDVYDPDFFRAARTLLRGAHRITTDLCEHRLDEKARSDSVGLIESTPWSDRRRELETLREAVRLALEATRQDFRCWQEGQECLPFEDETSVPPEEVDGMPDAERLVYVARLLRTVALMLGLNNEFEQLRGPFHGVTRPCSLLALIEDLDAMAAESAARRRSR